MIEVSNKILIFTDLHFGIHSNSQSYIDICSKTLKWISETCSRESIRDVLFLGDFFDSRASIDVKTLNLATQSLYDLADSGVSINMILGNHDIYLRDSTSIHSLLPFSGRSNIHVIDSPETLVSENGVKGIMLPWMFGTSANKVNVPRGTKYAFTHHNFPMEFFIGGKSKRKKHSDTYLSKTPYEDEYGIQQDLLEEIVANQGVFFSGHIHQRKSIPINTTATIVICGSPYETSWGFGGVDCGAYILDMKDDSMRFMSNPHNKVHVEIRTSDADVDIEKVDFPKSIVRLNVDTQESFDTISKLQAKIASFKPFSIENTKYEFTVAEFVGNRDEIGDPNDLMSEKIYSKLNYILNAIENADFSQFAYMENDRSVQVDKKRLKDIAIEIYDESTAKRRSIA